MQDRRIFRFKQFSVRHDRVAMKVGTDSVLLGAWVDLAGAKKILDVGSGSGLIALMLAQRTSSDVTIDAVEISQEDYLQGKENIEASSWAHRIRPIHGAIQDFDRAYPYDLVVSNPPFFTDGLRPPDHNRAGVRHAVTLTFHDLLSSSRRLLSPAGKLGVVLPPVEAGEFQRVSLDHNLHTVRKTIVHTRAEKPPERILLELSAHPYPYEQDTLTLVEKDRTPSMAYRRLTEAFYL